jgi:hypothetical protein
MPSRSSSRSCWISIFCDTPGKAAFLAMSFFFQLLSLNVRASRRWAEGHSGGVLAVVRDHVLDLAGRDSHDVDSVADHVAGNTKNATGRALDYAGCGRALTATTPPLDGVTCLLAIQLVKDLIGSSSLGRCEGEFSHFFGIERSCHDS